jgi:2-phosphosulfolactate phosphatase
LFFFASFARPEMKIDAILTPAELPALAGCSFRRTVCVVFDVLRATSTFATALQNGAKEIIPVGEIAEALAFKNSESGIRNPESILLGGERDGVRISVGGIDFDLGNSPREYTPEKVRGKTIVSTTTNGTRALRACTVAKTVLAASFLNLGATTKFLLQQTRPDILLVCAGTREDAALEDILAAGALCEALKNEMFQSGVRVNVSDAAEITLQNFAQAKEHLAATVVQGSKNARRLLAIPGLRDDVAFCLQRDTCPLVAKMEADGGIRRG